MTQTILKPLTFEEFVAWYPEDGRYELIDGIVTEMQPTGEHEDVTEFVATALTLEVNRRALIKAPTWNTGYLPDVLVVDKQALLDEPLWSREATITRGNSVRLVVEVVSTNWETDYARKSEDYESLGIAEYWIVDHMGLGGKKYIGSPKQPTISVCKWVDGEYQITQFRGGDRLISPTFPDLQLTAEQILNAGQ
jgi:Uma2 family endonuclease